MFFRRKHLVGLDYKVMGLDFNRNDTYNNYVKYFPKHHSMVVMSTVHNNQVMVYKLTPQQYRNFEKGKYALSHDGKGSGTTPTGHEIKNYGFRPIFNGGEITRVKYLKEILDVAEEIAQGKEVEFSINSRVNRIKK